VRVETHLNRFIWASGIRNVPRKVRIRVSRKRSEDEDAKEKFYCIVSHLPVRSFQGLLTEKA
jgi:large subunit ribosomal protein L31e